MRASRPIALLALLLLAGRSVADFTPPTNITPFLPAQNTFRIAALPPAIPNVDQYRVTPTDTPASAPFTLSVTHGTAFARVNVLAGSNISFAKFKLATLQPGDLANPFQLQVAGAWWANNIGRPFFGF